LRSVSSRRWFVMADKPQPVVPPGTPALRPGHALAAPGDDHRNGVTRTKWAYVIGIGLGLAITAGVVFFLVRNPEDPPARQLETALRLLDEGRDQSARRIATRLQDKGYQDPDFAGGVPFVLGICAFRDAGAHDDVTRTQRYITAVGFLRDAERLSLPDDRRPEWAFAAGISLHRTGLSDEAQPLLEEAVRSYPPGKHEAGLIVTQIYMDGRTRENLEQALALNSQLVADAT